MTKHIYSYIFNLFTNQKLLLSYGMHVYIFHDGADFIESQSL